MTNKLISVFQPEIWNFVCELLVTLALFWGNQIWQGNSISNQLLLERFYGKDGRRMFPEFIFNERII